MNIEWVRQRTGQPLADAFIAQDEAVVAARFNAHPSKEADWQQRWQQLQQTTAHRVPAEQLADVLDVYNERVGASPMTLAQLAHLRQGAPVVVGGQQAGLLTGPMLVIHKAVSVIQAAKHAQATIGRPVVPLFWIAGEDHDWDEVNHTFVPDQQSSSSVTRLNIVRSTAVRTSVSRMNVTPAQMEQVMDKLAASLADTVHKRQLLQLIRQCAHNATNLSDWFASILARLFADEGLVVLDADDPSLRQLESPMFVELIERNDDIEAALLAGASSVRELGFKEQVAVTPDSANLFIFHREFEDEAPERLLLYKRAGRYETRTGSAAFEREQLLALAEHSPTSLSNNVLTRPLMQEYVLPVLATVLGPAEIAYWGLTKEAFAILGRQLPIIVPRMTFTLIEPHVAKLMKQFHLQFDTIGEELPQRQAQVLAELDQFEPAEQFAQVRKQFSTLYGPLLQQIKSLDHGLIATADKNMDFILTQIIYMEQQVRLSQQRRHEVVVKQFHRLSQSVRPLNKMQERVLNVSYFWNHYGTRWIADLLATPIHFAGQHGLLYI